MHLAFNGVKRTAPRRRLVRLPWVSSGGAQAFQLLQGCPVVTIEGKPLGSVEGLMVDSLSYRPRFVTLGRQGRSCPLALPWHSLYFDSSLAHLVFYTYDKE